MASGSAHHGLVLHPLFYTLDAPSFWLSFQEDGVKGQRAGGVTEAELEPSGISEMLRSPANMTLSIPGWEWHFPSRNCPCGPRGNGAAKRRVGTEGPEALEALSCELAPGESVFLAHYVESQKTSEVQFSNSLFSSFLSEMFPIACWITLDGWP